MKKHITWGVLAGGFALALVIVSLDGFGVIERNPNCHIHGLAKELLCYQFATSRS